MYLKPFYFINFGSLFKLNLFKIIFFQLLFILLYQCACNVCVSITLKSLKKNGILHSTPSDINFDKSLEKSNSEENVSQPTPTLFSTTLKDNVKLLNSTLTLLQNDKRKKNEVNRVSLCEKDYSELCPDGWSKRMVNGNFICVASKSYSGNCSTIIKQSLTEEDKSMFETECEVNWPCMDYCERDYTVLCPLNWEESHTKLCHAGATYTDRCARVKDFSHFTVEMKKAWSLSCNLLWPCIKKCKQNYSYPCPEGWSVIRPLDSKGYTCSSPKTYTGPCGPEEAITMFDEQLKKAFAERCQVDFPCLKSETNERDYRILCPKDWLAVVESTSCQAPDNYTGPCDTIVYPSDYSLKDKKLYEMKCNVRWPDLEKCKPNYDEPCPDSWEVRVNKQGFFNKNKNGDCFPLPSYQGPCVGPKRLWDKTPDMKEAFAQVCSAPWKCNLKTDLKKPKIKPFLKKIYSGKNGPISPHTGHISV